MRKELKKVIEKIAIKAASSNVNETCSWITYQPKVPESVKKLKKTLYLIFDYPYKYYTFKHFEV